MLLVTEEYNAQDRLDPICRRRGNVRSVLPSKPLKGLATSGSNPCRLFGYNGETPSVHKLFANSDTIMDMGNTVGSRTNNPQKVDWAYIAGFFDGDGSLMAQVKNRRDTSTGWRIMFTICLYQDTNHKEPLQWIRSLLNIGYISDRNDGISEFRINGYSQVKRILEGIKPYVRFKKKQVKYALKILSIIEGKKFSSLSIETRGHVADWIINLREANYKSHHNKYSSAEIRNLLTVAF